MIFFLNTIQSCVTVLCLVASPISAAHAQDLTKICLKLPCSRRGAVISPCLLSVGAGSAGILGNLGAVFLGAVTGHCDSASVLTVLWGSKMKGRCSLVVLVPGRAGRGGGGCELEQARCAGLPCSSVYLFIQ